MITQATSRTWLTAIYATLFWIGSYSVVSAQYDASPFQTVIEVDGSPVILEGTSGLVAQPNAAGAKATDAESSAPGDAADKAMDKRKKERLDAIKKLVFDRRPSAILNVWSASPEDDSEAKSDSESTAAAEDSDLNAPESEAANDEVLVEAYEVPMAAAADAVGGSDAEPNAELEKERNEDPQEDLPADEKNADEKSDDDEAAVKQAADAAAEKAAKELEAKLKADKEQFDRTTKRLTTLVTKGDWKQFSATLNNRDWLSGKEAVAVFDRLLTQMAARPTMDFSQVVGLSDDMRQFMQSMMSNRRNNPAVEYAEKHIINVPDLVGIIRSAPAEIRLGSEEPDQPADPNAIEPAKLARLAALLRACLALGNPLDEFTAAIKAEGEELNPSLDVARMPSFAGRNEATSDFLPTLEDAAESKNGDALNLLAKHYLTLYREEKKESLRVKAWECSLAVLESEDTTQTKAREEAFARAIQLAPQLENDLGESWLQESFTHDVHRGQEIMAKLGTATAQRLAMTPQDGNARGANLELQFAAVQSFLDTGAEIDQQWQGILNLLATNWLKEADVTQQRSSRSRYGATMRRDRYGNMYYVEEQEPGMDAGQQMLLRRINPVDVETIIQTAPTGKWFDAINESLQPKFTAMLCRLWLKVNEGEKAFPYIETLARSNPDTARELAEEFLRVWTRNHNPNEASQRTNSYMFMFGYDQKADKIPLTRSKQERNLKELSQWIKRLRALPLEGEDAGQELDENLLVSAFMTCHSVAEVYDIEDIEKVFGAWQTIEAGTMAGLIDRMRANLGTVWRDPNVQRDAKTKRKKQDIQVEVVRGYDTAERVLARALNQYPGNWQLLLSKACIMHDENDFQQSVSPSSQFSANRSAAFELFQQAADAYVTVAPELPEREQSGQVFDTWFYASLGATDLGGISEDNRPAPKQIDAIKASMESLPGEVGQRHKDQFANALFTRMSAVSPACKFRYLDAGFQLVDLDDPKAVEAKKVYDYYNDLVTELELVTRLDGDARVGHQSPFGVYVDLRHTKELERESGGFAKYLQNQKSGYYFAYNYGRPNENYRDKFQDAATKILEEQFEVLSVTFNHPETKSRDEGGGWRVTPYAYLLLKARGPEIDKVPALKMDMDFMDTSGYVVLPIDSSPLPIDATESVSASAAATNIDMLQLLDERQSTEGKLIVESRVTARGLVPDLNSLVETRIEGFKLATSEDSDVSVIEFDQEAAEPIIVSERTFTLEYVTADPAKPAPNSFSFPEPIIDLKKVTYQRYVDADLEEVDATVALAQEYGSNRRAWLITGICTVAGLLLLAGLIVAARSNRKATTTHEEAVPEAITPFGLLTRLRTYESSDLPTDRKSQLSQDIRSIESYFFAEANGQQAPDLQTIASRWSAISV